MEENLIRHEYRNRGLVARGDRNMALAGEALEEAWRDLADSADRHDTYKNKCAALESFIDILRSQGEPVSEMLRDSDDIYLVLWIKEDRWPSWMDIMTSGMYIRIMVRSDGIYSNLTSEDLWIDRNQYHVLAHKDGDNNVLVLKKVCSTEMQLRRLDPTDGSSYEVMKRIINSIAKAHKPLQDIPGAKTSTCAISINKNLESWD